MRHLADELRAQRAVGDGHQIEVRVAGVGHLEAVGDVAAGHDADALRGAGAADSAVMALVDGLLETHGGRDGIDSGVVLVHRVGEFGNVLAHGGDGVAGDGGGVDERAGQHAVGMDGVGLAGGEGHGDVRPVAGESSDERVGDHDVVEVGVPGVDDGEAIGDRGADDVDERLGPGAGGAAVVAVVDRLEQLDAGGDLLHFGGVVILGVFDAGNVGAVGVRGVAGDGGGVAEIAIDRAVHRGGQRRAGGEVDAGEGVGEVRGQVRVLDRDLVEVGVPGVADHETVGHRSAVGVGDRLRARAGGAVAVGDRLGQFDARRVNRDAGHVLVLEVRDVRVGLALVVAGGGDGVGGVHQAGGERGLHVQPGGFAGSDGAADRAAEGRRHVGVGHGDVHQVGVAGVHDLEAVGDRLARDAVHVLDGGGAAAAGAVALVDGLLEVEAGGDPLHFGRVRVRHIRQLHNVGAVRFAGIAGDVGGVHQVSGDHRFEVGGGGGAGCQVQAGEAVAERDVPVRQRDVVEVGVAHVLDHEAVGDRGAVHLNDQFGPGAGGAAVVALVHRLVQANAGPGEIDLRRVVVFHRDRCPVGRVEHRVAVGVGHDAGDGGGVDEVALQHALGEEGHALARRQQLHAAAEGRIDHEVGQQHVGQVAVAGVHDVEAVGDGFAGGAVQEFCAGAGTARVPARVHGLAEFDAGGLHLHFGRVVVGDVRGVRDVLAGGGDRVAGDRGGVHQVGVHRGLGVEAHALARCEGAEVGGDGRGDVEVAEDDRIEVGVAGVHDGEAVGHRRARHVEQVVLAGAGGSAVMARVDRLHQLDGRRDLVHFGIVVVRGIVEVRDVGTVGVGRVAGDGGDVDEVAVDDAVHGGGRARAGGEVEPGQGEGEAEVRVVDDDVVEVGVAGVAHHEAVGQRGEVGVGHRLHAGARGAVAVGDGLEDLDAGRVFEHLGRIVVGERRDAVVGRAVGIGGDGHHVGGVHEVAVECGLEVQPGDAAGRQRSGDGALVVRGHVEVADLEIDEVGVAGVGDLEAVGERIAVHSLHQVAGGGAERAAAVARVHGLVDADAGTDQLDLGRILVLGIVQFRNVDAVLVARVAGDVGGVHEVADNGALHEGGDHAAGRQDDVEVGHEVRVEVGVREDDGAQVGAAGVADHEAVGDRLAGGADDAFGPLAGGATVMPAVDGLGQFDARLRPEVVGGVAVGDIEHAGQDVAEFVDGRAHHGGEVAVLAFAGDAGGGEDPDLVHVQQQVAVHVAGYVGGGAFERVDDVVAYAAQRQFAGVADHVGPDHRVTDREDGPGGRVGVLAVGGLLDVDAGVDAEVVRGVLVGDGREAGDGGAVGVDRNAGDDGVVGVLAGGDGAGGGEDPDLVHIEELVVVEVAGHVGD